MGIYWGDHVGHASCLTTQNLAEQLRLADIGGSATIQTFLTALDGNFHGALTFTRAQAEEIRDALNEAAGRISPTDWQHLAVELAYDAAAAGGWTVE
ncbi:hypothetical protein ACFXPX_04675 [Kitasatospora sp. NPDC059146]|uniref:DUF7739 domain-containing protein n=1 Tax=unclassified Kitasatospora TaxID=2633591 RepID=UPI0036ADA08C